MELEIIDLTVVNSIVKEIDECVDILSKEIVIEKIGDLEYNIYTLSNELRNLRLAYNNNCRLLAIEKDKKFRELRPIKNSDLATSKEVNTYYRVEITTVELQEGLIDCVNEKLWSARRYADHANSVRIGMLADAKRA